MNCMTTFKKHLDAEFLFTDTNSLAYEIKSGHIYEESFNNKNLFDLSNHLKNSKFLILLMKNLLVKCKTCLKEK